MAEYRNKPRQIEAVQYQRGKMSEYPEWITKAFLDGKLSMVHGKLHLTSSVDERNHNLTSEEIPDFWYVFLIEDEIRTMSKESFEENFVRVGK